MSIVVEGLIMAIKGLPKEDKSKIINYLLEDPDFLEARAESIRRKHIEIIESNVGEDIDSSVVKLQYRKDSDSNISSSTLKTSREHAQALRENYLSELQKKLEHNHIHIKQFGNVWALTSSGLPLALPFATERNPDRWFLGLPESDVNEHIKGGGISIILLCQSASGNLQDFILPMNIVDEIVPKLGKSHGQLKFNLKKSGDKYYLDIPRNGSIDISDYLGKISYLIKNDRENPEP